MFIDKMGQEIHVGDVVNCTPYMSHTDQNLTGIVVVINEGSTWGARISHPIGVDFGLPDNRYQYHNLSGKIPRRTGYRFPSRCVIVQSNQPLLGDDDEDCV